MLMKRFCRAALLWTIALLSIPSEVLFVVNASASAIPQTSKSNKKKQKKHGDKRKEKILKGRHGRHKGKPA